MNPGRCGVVSSSLAVIDALVQRDPYDLATEVMGNALNGEKLPP